MASQLFIYDNRNGSTLLYQIASNSNSNTLAQWYYLKKDAMDLISNIINQEIANTNSTLVQVVITKG